MKVRKAIIPAAGLGTRFLPATKAQPKEMLPIVDKPTLQYTKDSLEYMLRIIDEYLSSYKNALDVFEGLEYRKINEDIDNT